MRFDDSLTTVLSADMTPGMGAQAAWRQIVDLTGRGRIATDPVVLARLAELRAIVPLPVRAASARALAFARPDAALVGFFAQDELAVAAPVLRTAELSPGDWLDLLGRLTPACRSVLRQRRDLPVEVERGLESFGSVDFVIADARADAAPAVEPLSPPLGLAPEPVAPEPMAPEPMAVVVPADTPAAIPDAPLSPTPFVALGDVARGLPLVAEALRQVDAPADAPRFEIADLVARIDAFQRRRDEAPDSIVDDVPPVADERESADPGFRFETDAAGVIRWVEGVARAALVGVSLTHAARQGCAQVDASVAAAVRARSRFADRRLEVDGLSDAAGSWRIAGAPMFDEASGRFTGYRGIGRMPHRHETAARSSASDQLRQLVHELRTPANAVAGFAELIETQLLGPVSDIYRSRAASIRTQAADLLAAIDDLDTAARIEGRALDLRPTLVPLRPLLDRVARDLTPLAFERGAAIAIAGEGSVDGDDRAVERLFARLLAALVSASQRGERIGVGIDREGDRIRVVVDRPGALADLAGDALFSLDGRLGEEDAGTPLLGAGFTLRLVRNLAVELGGALEIAPRRLTLRLPAAGDRALDQASFPIR